MSRQQEEIRITVNYCDDIQKELRENGHKPHWKDSSIVELCIDANREFIELLDEIRNPVRNCDRIISESADIGAYCAMISDNARRAKAEQLTITNAEGKACSV